MVGIAIALLVQAWAASPSQGAPELVAGRTVIPRLASQAATNQARFCSNICATLAKIPMETRVYQNPTNSGPILRYRLFKPACVPAKAYPLIVSLHGGGPARNFDDLLKCSSPFFAFGPARFVYPAEQVRHPAFVLVPWSGRRGWDDENTRLIAGLIERLRSELPIDSKRVYITGQSMGGYGTWQMIAQYPELFAAAVPVCGGGIPSSAPKAKSVPVWAFHGSADGLVPVTQTRNMIEALMRAGGRPIYWEYEGTTHAVTAERAYCENGLLDWMFNQSKASSMNPAK